MAKTVYEKVISLQSKLAKVKGSLTSAEMDADDMMLVHAINDLDSVIDYWRRPMTSGCPNEPDWFEDEDENDKKETQRQANFVCSGYMHDMKLVSGDVDTWKEKCREEISHNGKTFTKVNVPAEVFEHFHMDVFDCELLYVSTEYMQYLYLDVDGYYEIYNGARK